MLFLNFGEVFLIGPERDFVEVEPVFYGQKLSELLLFQSPSIGANHKRNFPFLPESVHLVMLKYLVLPFFLLLQQLHLLCFALPDPREGAVGVGVQTIGPHRIDQAYWR